MISGLSAAYGGYQGAAKNEGEIIRNLLENQQRSNQLQGAEAFGRALPGIFQAQVPNAMPMGPQGPQSPLPPGPGQVSPPNGQIENPHAWTGMVPPGTDVPPMFPGNPAAGPAPMMPPGPMGPQAGPPQAPQMPMQPQGPQAGPMGMQQPQIDWQTAVLAIQRSNPNISPAAMAGAVDKLFPIMNAQSQQQWQRLRMQLQAQALENRVTQSNRREDRQERTLDETTRRFDVREDGRNNRANAQNEIRRENVNQRDQQFQARESRLEKRLSLDMERLAETVRNNNQRSADMKARSATVADLRKWEGLNRQLHNAMTERIQAARDMTGPQKEQAMAEAKTRYDTTLQEIERQRATVENPQGPAAPSQTPNAPQRQNNAPAQLPPQAVTQLKEGQTTTFNNGQQWTLQNGQPVRVK